MSRKYIIAQVIRWIARLVGGFILAFLLYFLLAHLLGNDESGNDFQSTQEIIMFIFYPVSTLLGWSLAYKWEGLGGLITNLGIIGLIITSPDLLNTFQFLIPVVPGSLYVIYWLLQKSKAHQHSMK